MALNPTTNYKLSTGQDLSGIFQPIVYGSSAPALTNFNVNGYGDLSKIFAQLSGGTQYPNPTGYTVKNYNNTGQTLDLNNIFAKYNPLPFTTSATGGYNRLSTSNPNSYGYVFSGGGTLQLNNIPYNFVLNYQLVGGGGGGVVDGVLDYNFIMV